MCNELDIHHSSMMASFWPSLYTDLVHCSYGKEAQAASPMASVRGSVPTVSAVRSRSSSLPFSISSSTVVRFSRSRIGCRPSSGGSRRLFRAPVYTAMVQQASQGASATYAKDMERLSAKESLLLAFKDSGGFEALVTGKTTEMQRIDVNERITGLERLNPTPRPTTSSFLEGKWNFEWFGSGSPGLAVTKIVFPRFPLALAKLSKMDAVIKNGYSSISAYLILLNSIENKVTFSSKLTVEGPLRLKEEYVEAIFDAPNVAEETLPALKGPLSQAASLVQELPLSIRDIIDGGLKVPLSGTFQRLLMVSYLDEEILIIRGSNGVPEVLTRLDVPPSPSSPISEYESFPPISEYES